MYVTAIFTFSLIVHAISGTSVPEVIAELRPQINSARIQISLAIADAGIKMGNANAIIHSSVSLAEESFADRISTMKNEAILGANGKNIDECLQPISLTKADFLNLELCRTAPELNFSIKDKIVELKKGEWNISNSINSCAAQYVIAEDLKKCIGSDLRFATNLINTIQSEITNTITDAEEKSRTCIKNADESLDTKVDNLEKQLETCLPKYK